jgi:elongator complex protein 1
VHSIDKSINMRKFQVFTRDGVLHSTSENIASLESAIVWTNSKALITSSTHKANKHEIIFYERNGLSHGSFTLPFTPKEFKVNNISWNFDSNILCVWLERISSSDNEVQSVGKFFFLLKFYL